MRGYKDPEPRLPPGCRSSDIPGNRPRDIEWLEWLEESDEPLDVFEDHYGREPEDRLEVLDKEEEDEDFRDYLGVAFEESRREKQREPPEPSRPDREAHERRID